MAARLLACILVSTLPSPVSAESAPPQDSGSCAPGESAVWPPPPDVQANWPYFAFDLSGGYDAGEMRLVRVNDGFEVGLQQFYARSGEPLGTLVVHPMADLVVGERYDLHHPRCPESPPVVSRYLAVAPIVAPASLGTITVSELYAANRLRGIVHREYFVVVELTPDPGALEGPWPTVLSWEARVTGSFRRAGGGGLEQPEARMPVACMSEGIPPGPQTFRADGFAVYTRVLFTTPDAPVTIAACEDAMRVDADTLRPLTPGEIAFWDTLPPDAGINIDAGLDAGPTTRSDDSGCACEVATSTGTPSAWLVVLALLVGTLTIRRRAKQ